MSKQKWEADLEHYLTNSLWINKKTTDEIIAYVKAMQKNKIVIDFICVDDLPEDNCCASISDGEYAKTVVSANSVGLAVIEIGKSIRVMEMHKGAKPGSADTMKANHGEIERLKAEAEQSLLLYNNQTATIFKLEAENSKMRKLMREAGYCTMCLERKTGEGLEVCKPCYDSFDGDRRGFWKDEDY